MDSSRHELIGRTSRGACGMPQVAKTACVPGGGGLSSLYFTILKPLSTWHIGRIQVWTMARYV